MSELLSPIPNDILVHEIVQHLEIPWRWMLWCALTNRTPKRNTFNYHIETIGAEGESITKYFVQQKLLSESQYRFYALIYGWECFKIQDLYPLSATELELAAYGPHDLMKLYKDRGWIDRDKHQNTLYEICRILILCGKLDTLLQMLPAAGITVSKEIYKFESVTFYHFADVAMTCARLDIAKYFILHNPNEDVMLGANDLNNLLTNRIDFSGIHRNKRYLNTFSIPTSFTKLVRFHEAELARRTVECLEWFMNVGITPTRAVHNAATIQHEVVKWLADHGLLSEDEMKRIIRFGSIKSSNLMIIKCRRIYDSLVSAGKL